MLIRYEIGGPEMGLCCIQWFFLKTYYSEGEEFRLVSKVTTWFDHGGYDGSDHLVCGRIT